MLDTDGLAGSTRINVTTNVSLSAITGPLDFNFGNYKVDPESPPVVNDPNSAAIPVPEKGPGEFTVGSYNIENFANAENQGRKAALAIRNVMRSPDILGVIEIFDLAALQALADQINSDSLGAGDPDPGYTAHLIQAPAGGSQNIGFLVKGSVQVNSVTQERGTETFINPTTGLPEILHDRPPLVLNAAVNGPADPREVIVVVNHPRSFIDVERLDATGIRVREKRKAQGESIAGLIQELQTANPGTPVIAVGDYNAYQFNDGYTDPVATIKGTPTTDDEVVVDASPDLVDPDLVNLTDGLPEDEKYSFIFEGTPQAIDHIFVNTDANAIVTDYTVARINSDFPETPEFEDVSRPERSSDHDGPVAYFRFPERETTTTVSDVDVIYNVSGQNVALSANIAADVNTVNEGSVTFTVTNENGSTIIGTAGPVDVVNGSAAANFFLPGNVLPQSLRITADFTGGLTTLPSSGTGSLNVNYAVCLLYDPGKQVNGGSTIPIKLQLCDSNGSVVPSGDAATALFISPAGDPNTQIPAEDSGNSNPGNLFRYNRNQGSYIFNLKTKGLDPGSYLLHFSAGNDPRVHTAGFTIR